MTWVVVAILAGTWLAIGLATLLIVAAVHGEAEATRAAATGATEVAAQRAAGKLAEAAEIIQWLLFRLFIRNRFWRGLILSDVSNLDTSFSIQLLRGLICSRQQTGQGAVTEPKNDLWIN